MLGRCAWIRPLPTVCAGCPQCARPHGRDVHDLGTIPARNVYNHHVQGAGRMFWRRSGARWASTLVVALVLFVSCKDAGVFPTTPELRLPHSTARFSFMQCTYIGGVLSECHTEGGDDNAYQCAINPRDCPGYYVTQIPGAVSWVWRCDAFGCVQAPETISSIPGSGGDPEPPPAPLPTAAELDSTVSQLDGCRKSVNPALCKNAVELGSEPAVYNRLLDARARTASTGRESGSWIFRDVAGNINVGPLLDGAYGNPPCDNGGHCMPQFRYAPPGAIGMLHAHPQDPLPSGADQTQARNQKIYSYIISAWDIYAVGPTGQVVMHSSRSPSSP